MRSLFEIDTKDYDINGTSFSRPSVRALILRGNEIAMIHSIKYNYYKFPGGGIEPGETMEEALIREVREEAGLNVRPQTIREYGMVHRIQKGDYEDVFIQDNYYYLCETGENIHAQNLDDYEADEQFTLEYIQPAHAIKVNRRSSKDGADPVMVEREARVLELLMQEGMFEVKDA